MNLEKSNNRKSNKKAYGKLSIMLLLSLITQIILLFKSSRVAALYGTSVEMDAYNFVNSTATFIFSFIGSGVGTVLIPYMAKEQSITRAQNGFLTLLYGSSFALIILCYVLRNPLLTVFSSNSSQFVSAASSLMAIILLSQLLTSLNTVSSAFLQCRDCYNVPKILTLVAAIVSTTVLYIADTFSIYYFAVLSFAMILLEIILQYVIAFWKGFRYSPCIAARDPELKRMFAAFLPTVFGGGVYQLSLLTDSLISSTLGEGSISVLSYSSAISGIINTVIATNIGTYIYPKIAAEVNEELGKKKLFQYMTFFAAIMCAVVILFVAAGYDSVRILFERGAFESDATMGVFICVLIYLLGSPINIMRDVVYRYFYSNGNTKSTFYNGLSASILNIVISIILAKFMGLYGVVIGTTITAVFSFISILLRMKKQYTFGGNFPFFAKELTKVACATVAAVITCVILKMLPLPLPSLAVSILSAVTAMVVFAAVLFVSRSNVFKVDLG